MSVVTAGSTSSLQLVLVAITISLDTFAAALALGTRLERPHWFRVALVFAVVGGIAPLLGVILGILASEIVAQVASGLGVLVLAALGGWFLHSALTGGRGPHDANSGAMLSTAGAEGSDLALGALFVLALGLSSDNVVVGLGLGLQGGVPAILGGMTALSVFFSTLGGLALGSLGFTWFGQGALGVAGLLLLGLAVAFLVGST
jgi:putative Mn2+ efflux pump MntP